LLGSRPGRRDAAGIPVRHGEAQVFSRVTMGFGAALVAVSVIAGVSGATTTSTAVIPAILGTLFILFGWLGRQTAAQATARQRSPSLLTFIVAAALVFSSARGITLVADALGAGATPSATGIFLFVMVLAGVGYIVFGAWLDITVARQVARTRATATPPRPRRSGR
jgi:hypothetical protein